MSALSHFDVNTLTFGPTPIDEARLLLRPVLPGGNLGNQLPFLPATLASLVGQPCAVTQARLTAYLTAQNINTADLGGALNQPVSSSHNNTGATRARFFVIHDTSSPTYNNAFPGNINTAAWTGNNLASHLGPNAVAHLFINRVGQSATGHDYRTPWRATKIESHATLGTAMKGLFLHHELIQPRRIDSHGHDSISPDPGFSQAQYDRLALLYVTASVRRGSWLVPAYHCPLDDFSNDGHDDPQKFSLAQWNTALEALLATIGGNAMPAALAAAPAPAQGVSPLFNDLVHLYATTDIEFPHLKVVTIAQWMLESGRGSSGLCQDHLNFGGLKYRSEMAGWATSVPYQAHDGLENYCAFDSLRNFIRGYWHFMDRDPYEGWRNHCATGEDYIRFIGPIYDTASYADKVIPLMPEAANLLNAALPGGGAMMHAVAGAHALPPAPQAGAQTIVIDPGHGGSQTVGGSSPNNATARPSGIKEKTMTLDMARRVRTAVQAQAPAVTVVLTRDDDVNVGISARARVAADNNASLFLSIHFNDNDSPVPRGVETWIRAVSHGNINHGDDRAFAELIQQAAFGAILALDQNTRDRHVKNDDERPDSLGVLNDNSLGTANNGCRACLLELEFISAPAVDALFNTSAGAAANKDSIAQAIAHALIASLPGGGGGGGVMPFVAAAARAPAGRAARKKTRKPKHP